CCCHSDMPIEGDAFIEPITVRLHAFHPAQSCEKKNVISVGAGTIDLLALQCARELGARSVTAIDIKPQKLELAKALGATQTGNSREMTADDIKTALSDIQFDQLVPETAGTPHTVALAIDIARPLAQLALVGPVT
ncbi:zinc-binding dehydrogenase, partial [Salmonella enterica]|uniref:zinc-binding dehydrogenase n=1 Tax=Salmonella enterica TaxID=28901 RepID=UPI00398C3F56